MRERRRTAFDSVAELYERVRPGYPERLFDDLAAWSGLGRRARVLEIGCGTGKATLELARRGWRVTALEPGANLARLARAKLARFRGVRIEERTFEEWRPARPAFDLVLAAQSFHFVDPAVGLRKAARLLRPGGTFAIVSYRLRRAGSEAEPGIRRAYAREAPALGQPRPEAAWADRLDETGRFGTVFTARYLARHTYPAADYVALLETQSDHRLLVPAARTRLLRAVARAIDAADGSIVVRQTIRLHLARRRARRSEPD